MADNYIEKDILATPLKNIKGITPKNIDKFEEKLKLKNLGHLIMHLPRNYEDRSTLYALNEVILGNKCNVLILIKEKQLKEAGFKKHHLVVRGVDVNGDTVRIMFFYNSLYYNKIIQPNTKYIFYGEVTQQNFTQETYWISHPEVFDHNNKNNITHDKELTPIYPTTKGISQAVLRKIIDNGLNLVNTQNFENLAPKDGYPLIPQNSFNGGIHNNLDINKYSLLDSLRKIHHPPLDVKVQDIIEAKQPWVIRLVIEELLAKTLTLLSSKKDFQASKGVALTKNFNFVKQVIATLPFKLTNAQSNALKEILNDLCTDIPMMRLVQGDVGSGKTAVSILAIAHVVSQGYQACLMSPTSILSTQLYYEAKKLLSPFGIKVCLIDGKLKTRERKELQSKIKSGEIQVVVGTHALYSNWVEFNNLALAVIDEQHKFGVEQRLNLIYKQPNFKIHFLMMSATPLPRSISMTVFANLDLSIIDELPSGRTPVKTSLISETSRSKLIQRTRIQILENKRQVYWVCCLVEESESLNAKSALETYELLCQEMPDIKIGLIHGRMKEEEKDLIMQAFKNNELDMLIATTVIEVGVNVPNASIMIIENPERLGLSSIHQLRGRVGRGSTESFCILLYGENITASTKQRLEIFTQTNDGFIIAEKDMETRGTGDITGTAQSGTMQFMVANLQRDGYLSEIIYPIAKKMINEEPEVSYKLINRWMHDKNEYIQV